MWSFFSPRYRCLLLTLLLSAGGASAEPSWSQKAANPFDNNGDSLPDLGIAPENDDYEKHLATMAKAFGEESMVDNDLDAGEQARIFAFNHLRDAVTGRVSDEVQSLLSPLGTTNLNLLVDDEGKFTGSSGSLFTPWQDNNRYLTWTQFGVSQHTDGLVGNAGVGQRWVAGRWLLGYNTFYDTRFDDHLQRAGFGAEAWGEYLRFSANYYSPFGGWQTASDTLEQRLARGYDVTAQAYLPFYQHINTSVSFEQYFGDQVELFDSGTGYHNPVAVKVGLSYTPVPLFTLTASHKTADSGETQDQLGLKMNYQIGVALSKQLSADNVAAARSLSGSRYDAVTRSNLPVMEFRQRKTLSVFLATPPWQVQPGETLPLKLQIRQANPLKAISWQGDTQALSLTPPANNVSPDGWSIIVPAWDSSPEATNEYHLSVTVEDSRQQRVTSNWITLKLTPPVTLQSSGADSFNLMAP